MTDLSHWMKRPTPGLQVLAGRRVRLEPLDWAVHGEGLFAAIGGEANTELWRWMPDGPFASPDALKRFLDLGSEKGSWRSMVFRAQTDGAPGGEILGMAAYMRIRESDGSTEIGCVAFGPKLKRTTVATEALALMAGHVFDLGYRRYEWKCNTRNAASKRAAERFGFVFEGVFRNDMVTKGESRDTAWYSITDGEWPAVHAALDHWLADDNFAKDGSQKRSLESFRAQ
jgi:RimJ/RimL family protein N-acetyltransferase